MPFTGGLSPSPERCGGGVPTLSRVVDSISAQLGTAYDTSTTSNVYAQVFAYARAIAEAWSTNQRLANQWDPSRMTDFVSRWEAIFAIYPSPTDTDVARRARIAAAFARVGLEPTYQSIFDQLTAALGQVFVGITHTDSSSAVVFTPSTWPVGSHDSTGVLSWYSTVAHLAIQVTKPANYSNADFYRVLGNIFPILDSMLPAWVTWDWYRTDIHGSPGFYLDETNLDNEAFSV